MLIESLLQVTLETKKDDKLKELSPALIRLADKIMPKILQKTFRGQLTKSKSGWRFNYTILSSGFDTLRIGFPKVRKCYSCNHMNLKAMCDAVGATLHQVKFTTESDGVAFSHEKEVLAEFYKTFGNKKDMFERFVYTNGAWIIEFDGVRHWILDYQRSSYISLELYGLSQLDHDKGSVRFELLNRILHHYEPNDREENKLVLMGYDFHVDLSIDFDTAIKNLIVPYLWRVNKTRKKGHKLKLYPKGDVKRSVYFQKSDSNSNRTICCYDKRAKNDLDYDLTRFEFTVRQDTKRILNSSKEYLLEIQQLELRSIGIL
ncbi:MAG: hypothetical protein V2A75_11980 [Pseudomonadota bacterium]